MSDMERKFGRYAVRNLPLVMIILYAIGYMISMFRPQLLFMLTLDPYAIVHGQVWRILSWLLVLPGYSSTFATIIILYCYYSIGNALEHIWGTWKFNVFIFRGILLTVLSAFVWMGTAYLIGGSGFYGIAAQTYFSSYSIFFSTYYLNLSIIIGFAMTLPEAQFLLFFLLPVKAKYIALVDALYLAYGFVRGTMPGRFAVAATVVNLLIFWLSNRIRHPMTGAERRAWRAAAEGRPGAGTRRAPESAKTAAQENRTARVPFGRQEMLHRCAICGRTNRDHPELEFRFCSKCEGGVEYCQDHLFTHVHIRPGESPRLN